MPLGSGRTLCPALKSRPALLGQQTRTQRPQDTKPCLSAGRCPSAAGTRCSGTVPGPAPGRPPPPAPLAARLPHAAPPGRSLTPLRAHGRRAGASRRYLPAVSGLLSAVRCPAGAACSIAAPARRHPGAASGAGSWALRAGPRRLPAAGAWRRPPGNASGSAGREREGLGDIRGGTPKYWRCGEAGGW